MWSLKTVPVPQRVMLGGGPRLRHRWVRQVHLEDHRGWETEKWHEGEPLVGQSGSLLPMNQFSWLTRSKSRFTNSTGNPKHSSPDLRFPASSSRRKNWHGIVHWHDTGLLVVSDHVMSWSRDELAEGLWAATSSGSNCWQFYCQQQHGLTCRTDEMIVRSLRPTSADRVCGNAIRLSRLCAVQPWWGTCIPPATC